MRKRLLVFVPVLAFQLVVAMAADSPEVLKVEPPGWWKGHSMNPVRLMIRGRNLTGARLESADGGLQISRIKTNPSGTYLFADLRINFMAPAGPRMLTVRTSDGSANAQFEILESQSRAGRFQGFSPDDVIYLIMPDRFCNGDTANDDPPIAKGMLDRKKSRYYHGGDLQGIINRLPYLKELGITAIWLNPVYDNANRLNERETYNNEAITDYHGYGAVDFYAVDEHLGDIGKFRGLVESAHKLGLKVIQDQVVNHTGPYHPWVQDPPTPTWYNGTEKYHLSNTWQTWTLMDPYSDPAMQKATLEGWFINILPDLNQDDEEAARYLIQNTLWWIGMAGLDGIRQDTLPYVHRRFWRAWMKAIKDEYPDVTVVGEAWDGDPALVSFFQGGKARFDGIDSGIDALFDFPLLYPLRRAFAESKPIRELPQMLSHDHLYVKPDMLVTFLGNHDLQRFLNEPNADITGLKLAFTFLMTMRGIPLVYYGDEIGMAGGVDPDNRRDFPGGWSEDPRNAFIESGRTSQEQSIFSHVSRLTKIRAELETLRRGSLKNLVVTDHAYAFARITRSSAAIVVINNGPQPAQIEIPVSAARLRNGIALHERIEGLPEVRVQDGMVFVEVPARSAVIYAP